MKKLKVLQITDVTGGELDFYSEQLIIALQGKHISETHYFLTDTGILIDIYKDIDEKDMNILNAIEAGAYIRSMYYVDDTMFSHHIYDFRAKGMLDGVEYGEEHGVVFELECDAIRYKRFLSLIEDKIEVDGREFIRKENAIMIIEELEVSEVVELLLKAQDYKDCGSVCYIDLENGAVDACSEDLKTSWNEILIARLDKDCTNKDIEKLKKYVQYENYRLGIEEFYNELEE